MASEFRELLREHVENVGRLTDATTFKDRYELMGKVEETFNKILAFPFGSMSKEDREALDRVQEALK